MKNVLFTTTAVAALAVSGAAFAGAHDSGNFGIDVKASADLGNGYSMSATAGIDLELSETDGNDSDVVTFENAALKTPFGTLSLDDDIDGKTAADEFYNDRDGMAIDVPDADGDAGIKWVGDMGDFGYAISTGDSVAGADGTGEIPTNFTIGAGGTFGAAEVGFGYAEGAGAADDTIGVSADFSVGDYGIGLSFADGAATSIGVEADADFGDFGVSAFYAVNDSDDKYGVGVTYGNGPLSLSTEFNTGAGDVEDNIVVEVEYEVNDDITLYVGMDDSEGPDDGLWAGIKTDINDGISATIAYAEFDEAGDPEFKQGTSAYLTVKY